MKLLIVFITIFSPLLNAQIFKCERHDGSALYKDLPCKQQDFQSNYNFPPDPDATYASTHKELVKRRKRLTRQRIRAEKQLDLEQKKRLRLQGKCERVVQQMDLLGQRYRHGYTAKQRQSLDRKLAEYKLKRLKYCK